MVETSLCRICLQDGASVPIFESSEMENNILSKIAFCLQCENIEDVEGLPRHICIMCNNTLDTLFNFIKKFKQSCQILESRISIVKKENTDCSSYDLTEIKVDITRIKSEPGDNFDVFDDYEDSQPLHILKKVKKEVIKKPKQLKNNSSFGNQSNKIASSILEGNVFWDGEKWCMKISETSLKLIDKETKPKPQTKVNIPNIKQPPSMKLCDICGDVFQSADKLNNHKKKVHFKKPAKCPMCPKVCASHYYLKRHIRRKHEQSKDFMCSTCGQGFAYKGELTHHFKLVHEQSIRPKRVYACKFCDKTYKCGKSVLIHERSVHTGQRPAECSVCHSSFYHEDYLKEHMRLHTGETPFKCPICGRGYAQRGNMKSHLRIHRISELDAVTLSKIKPNYLKLLKG